MAYCCCWWWWEEEDGLLCFPPMKGEMRKKKEREKESGWDKKRDNEKIKQRESMNGNPQNLTTL